MPEERLTADDYDAIEYFHREKGDITRWSRWEERKPIIREIHPELVDAIERLTAAERTLLAVVEFVLKYH